MKVYNLGLHLDPSTLQVWDERRLDRFIPSQPSACKHGVPTEALATACEDRFETICADVYINSELLQIMSKAGFGMA